MRGRGLARRAGGDAACRAGPAGGAFRAVSVPPDGERFTLDVDRVRQPRIPVGPGLSFTLCALFFYPLSERSEDRDFFEVDGWPRN